MHDQPQCPPRPGLLVNPCNQGTTVQPYTNRNVLRPSHMPDLTVLLNTVSHHWPRQSHLSPCTARRQTG